MPHIDGESPSALHEAKFFFRAENSAKTFKPCGVRLASLLPFGVASFNFSIPWSLVQSPPALSVEPASHSVGAYVGVVTAWL
jgi:hypothetical protein